MKKHLKMIALIAAGVMMLTVLTGCSSDAQPTVTTAPTSTPTNTPEVIPAAVVEEATEAPEQAAAATQEASIAAPQIADGLDDTQRNSIIMLNYLAVLTQEINASQNSRLYLENAYSTLINNTYPNAVDSRTLSQLTSLLDTLERYRMVAVKRERLEFVYEQNRAQAIRSAVPNPLGLLSAVRSNDNKVRVNSILGLAASVVYMAVDSYTSYQSQSSQADLQYLQNGWALDDEAATALHNSRRDTFSYMIRIVGDYDLPGDLALSESAVDEFVAWENNSNVVQRIQFLEANVKTYQALGTYWLVLAESYFENGQYDKCLNAVASYEALGARIFRKDYEYARILPLAIISAGEVLDGDKYLAAAEDYIQKILDNTDYDDWASRYFAAQAYVELYARTNDSAYLRSAYEIVLNNVNSLVNEQKAMNAAYLAPVVTVEAPKGATKEQKDDIKKYNDLLKAERKTALPPVNEPLRLNCELLFALADKLQLSEQEQLLIENILHEKGQSIFLTAPIDSQYWFSPVAIDVTDMEISFDGKALTVPANLVSASSVITVTVTDPETGAVEVFTDWVVEKVDRKQDGDLDTFTVTYTSASSKKFKYAAGSSIIIEIAVEEDSQEETVVFEYATTTEKTWVVFDAVGFSRVGE